MADKYRRTLTLDLTPAEALAIGEAGPAQKLHALTVYLNAHRDDLETLAALFLPPGNLYSLIPGSVLIREVTENEDNAGLIHGAFTMHFSQGCADREDSGPCPFEIPYVLRPGEILIWADALPDRDTVDEF